MKLDDCILVLMERYLHIRQKKVRGDMVIYRLFKVFIWPVTLCVGMVLSGCGDDGDKAMSWSVTQRGSIIEIAYGNGTDFPQYAALHLESSYLRMNYGPDSGWGTSVILLSFLLEEGHLLSGSTDHSYLED